MPDLRRPLAIPLATSLGLLGWRPRTEDDQGLLRALFASTRRTELDLLGGDPDQQAAFVDLQLRARDRQRDATYPGATLGILTIDGIAVGHLDLRPAADVLELLELHIVPGLRGHGLGTAVLRRVLADADTAGLPVRLHVELANPARRLYERLGFVPAGRDAAYVLMERPAAGAHATGPARPSAPGPPLTPAEPAADASEVPSFPTYDDLAPHVGATVGRAPDGPDLELVAVDARPRRGTAGRVPYSALLAGPLDRPLTQGLHRLDLPPTGPVDAFLVPIQPADGRALYELVVS